MTYLEAGKYYYVFGMEQQDRIIVPTPGTSVEVAYWSGTEYVNDPASPMTAPGTVYTRQVRVRFIADGPFGIDLEESVNVAD